MGKSHAALTVLFLLGAVLAGCGPRVSVTRVGGLYEAKPKDCDIRFEQIDFQQGQARYKHIGMVTIHGDAEDLQFDDTNKQRVRTKACSLGGDIASLNASHSSGSTGVLQFNVWRAQSSEEGDTAGDGQTI